jgi:MSHA type pilus biogenesis protein MshL
MIRFLKQTRSVLMELATRVAGICCLLVIFGCSLGPSSMLNPQKHYPDKIPEQIKAESEKLAEIRSQLEDALQKKNATPLQLTPVMPVYNPLDDRTVSFSMMDEQLQMILYALAEAVGMNVIIDPGVQTEDKHLTLNFSEVPASSVLREVLSAFDLYYEIDGNVIRVKPYQERIFHLNFLNNAVNASFDVGGDVLGAGETETVRGLSGSFKLSGQSSDKVNPYDVLESMVKPLISKGGKYALNRMAGSLFVQDRPAVIRSIARLVRHFKEMESRQILIEARIIEVTLSDQYQYGIDWSVIRNLSGAATELNEASWSLGQGLVLSGTSGEFSIGAALDALNLFGDSKVVSNPSIRSKHGKPAMISVGTSFTYKKSVETTTYTGSSDNTTTTEVEVSTVFDGLILGVIPFIEADGRISLLINPIKSDVDQSSLVPEPLGAGSGESISLPKVSIKEISTTIGLHSGDVVILGGLIDKRRVTDNKGVPFLSSLPLLGYLFKDEETRDETRELVIILSVKLV